MRLGRGSLGRQRESLRLLLSLRSSLQRAASLLAPLRMSLLSEASGRHGACGHPALALRPPEAWAQTQLPLSSAAEVMWVVGGLSLWATIPSCPFKHRQQAPWPALHNAVPPVYFHLVHGHAVDVGFLRWTGFPGADRCHQRRQPSWIITTQTN